MEIERRRFWLVGWDRWRPHLESFIGFTRVGSRTTLVNKRLKPGDIFVIYGNNEAPSDDKNRVMFFAETNGELCSDEERTQIEEFEKKKKGVLPGENRQHAFGFGVSRAWRLVDPRLDIMEIVRLSGFEKLKDLTDKARGTAFELVDAAVADLILSKVVRRTVVFKEPKPEKVGDIAFVTELAEKADIGSYTADVRDGDSFKSPPASETRPSHVGPAITRDKEPQPKLLPTGSELAPTPRRPGPRPTFGVRRSEHTDGPTVLYALRLTGNLSHFTGRAETDLEGKALYKLGRSKDAEKRERIHNNHIPEQCAFRWKLVKQTAPYPAGDPCHDAEQALHQTEGLVHLGGEFFVLDEIKLDVLFARFEPAAKIVHSK